MVESMMSTLLQQARDAGFTAAAPLDIRSLLVLPAVRDACKENKCGRYGACWTCPPHCGTLDECRAHLAAYRVGLLVQTVGKRADCFDYEGMLAVETRHRAQLAALYRTLRATDPDMLVLGAGGCHICAVCACPGAPCRHPTRAISSMEAYGLLVSYVCKENHLPYYYGPDAIAFTGCCLLSRTA